MLEMKESINEEPMDLTEIPQQQHALLIQTAGPFCGDQQSVTSRLEAFSPVKNNRKYLHEVPQLHHMTLIKIIRLNQFFTVLTQEHKSMCE